MPLTSDEVKDMIRAHALWLESGNVYGKRAECRNQDDLKGANLQGVDFEGAYLVEADLTCANLKDAKLKGANLCGANLRGATLSGANLRYANLRDANLSKATLTQTDLRHAILSGARFHGAWLDRVILPGFEVAPLVWELHTEIEKVTRDPNALNMDTWHACETTHCRAGWAIVLAGKAGAALETLYGPRKAGEMIYLRNTGMIPNFFATNEEARADIERLASEESKRNKGSIRLHQT